MIEIKEEVEVIRQLVTECIHRTLLRQDFDDWYKGRFEAYVTGDLESELDVAQSTVQTLIMQDIRRFFNIDNL